MRKAKNPLSPDLTPTDHMLLEQRYDDYCKLTVAILKQLRADPEKSIGREQMDHLHNPLWVKYWYTLKEELRVEYRKKYRQMFIKGPPVTIPWSR